MKPTLAILLASHNRRDLTLRALRSVALSAGDFAARCILFDDASTDGTAEAVRREFPDCTVLNGDGNAFWNGGMHAAWDYARGQGFDSYLWLNDDVVLDADALPRLAQAWAEHREHPVVLVGATRGPDGGLTYGGMIRQRSPFALKFACQSITATPREVDTFNGNIVLVSAGVVEKIGINDPKFYHVMGDIDYGLRARAAGFAVILMPGTLGVCAANPRQDIRDLPFSQRWRFINSHRGLPFKSWWHLVRRHSGIWAPLHFVLTYRRLLYPVRVPRKS